ncbi:hypothetical protein [Shewanella xiamenensis]|uniref:hypothetical protein n=1 Tax=Shewanella xiamenensis TaxID=332186 RepID=UPI0036F23C33
MALNVEGKKELLGLYLSDNEGVHHWLSVQQTCIIAALKISSSPALMALKAFLKRLKPFTRRQRCNCVSSTKFATR